MTTQASLTRSPLARLVRQVAIDTQYVLIGFPIGLLTVSLFMALFFTGVGTLVIWVGIPILIATLMTARGFATLERARLGPVFGYKMPHPYYKKQAEGGFVRQSLGVLGDGQSWLDMLHGMFRFIPSTISFSLVITWWAGAIGGLTVVLWDWSVPHGPDQQDLPELLGMGSGTATRILFYFAVGVFFAGTLYPVVRASALLEAWFARGLLSGVNELREQVAEANAARTVAQQQKAAAVSAEANALRRLERDIHDGPQQRLVRLAMDLGRAEQQFATDPEAARATVAEALTQTRETLDELRALSRGIAPPILVDRGLQAALTALAGRSLVPVELDATLAERLEPTLESTAYFVVAEALTNVAKHSHANEVQVSVKRNATGLIVSIADDGVGGASVAKGHGLAGLDDRVRAAGGVLDVSSPAGGGTRLTAALPV
ncbi:sensor histidine kinase [Actinoplanes sp. TRM 88003]|uniref:histidine kinase n=1 Tax=Paractinoplanes aksuensis TaxID=2939490 RepID=A0ABT1DTU5_9ACTN|nr:sensor histidine kinase [Actinoplanes aksuensis]MCO8273456.1 sensor histidine kinase [Actinoplanes aksuensis]